MEGTKAIQWRIENLGKKKYFLKKNIISFKESTEDDIQSFYHALAMDESLREKRNKEAERLLVKTREMPVN